jgi:DNA-binding NtrC family response regulator
MAKTKTSASILVVDDEEAFRNVLSELLIPEGYLVATAEDGGEAINAVQSSSFDCVLLDVKMPHIDGLEVLSFIKAHYIDTQVIMLTAVDDVKIAVECMKLGAFHYLTKPYSTDELLAIIERALERRHLIIENKVMKSELARLASSSQIIGQSPSFMQVLELASRVAPTDSTVLIEGASGTGKELFANLLYRNSPRNEKPFVALNCASIAETLIESELFGHEKGSFTDAHQMRQGLVEIANGGTLFLDEIGEISAMFQPKLLRFIQTGEFRRVGGNKTLKSDVRIISATNRHLDDEVKAGRFREDLLYRLNVITLRIPPLRERREDIPILAKNILQRKAKARHPVKLSEDALNALCEYDWPGNVRELENVLERAAILSTNEIIHPKDLALPQHVVTVAASQPDGTSGKLGTTISLREIERDHIDGVLHQTKWNKIVAAKILGISLKTLYTKIQQYNLSRPQ